MGVSSAIHHAHRLTTRATMRAEVKFHAHLSRAHHRETLLAVSEVESHTTKEAKKFDFNIHQHQHQPRRRYIGQWPQKPRGVGTRAHVAAAAAAAAPYSYNVM